MHWYDKQGNPQHYTPYASKREGKRPTTIRDARKHGYAPSVTGITDLLAKPALNRWIQDQTIDAAIELLMPVQKWGEGDVAVYYTTPTDIGPEDAPKLIKAKAGEVAKKARDEGTRIHDLIEDHLFAIVDGVKLTATDSKILLGVRKAIPGEKIREQYMPFFKDWTQEQSFYSDYGYGGKVDLFNDEWVIDFKSKDFDQDDIDSGKVKGWPDQCMQLAAYDVGLQKGVLKVENYFPLRRLANIFISRTVPGLCHFFEWTDRDEINRHWDTFKCLLQIWRNQNQYDVRDKP